MKNKLQKFYRTEVLHMSQKTFEEITGVKQPNLSRHEKGITLSTVDRCFEDMGFSKWWESLHDEERTIIEWCVDGRELKRINELWPGIAPIPVEV